MKFQLGAFRYEVVIVDDMLEVDGEPAVASIDHFHGIVEIWKGNRGAQRKRCLAHELRHAWVKRFGYPPVDDEGDADHVGHFGQWFADSLEAQGGSRALDEMLSPREQKAAELDRRIRFVSVDDEAAEQPAVGSGKPASQVMAANSQAALLPPIVRPDAPCCGGYLPDRAVRNEPPKWDEGLWVQERAAYCANCDLVSLWCQPCTEGGRPLGNVPFGLVVLGSEESEEYLRRHPGLRVESASA